MTIFHSKTVAHSGKALPSSPHFPGLGRARRILTSRDSALRTFYTHVLRIFQKKQPKNTVDGGITPITSWWFILGVYPMIVSWRFIWIPSQQRLRQGSCGLEVCPSCESSSEPQSKVWWSLRFPTSWGYRNSWTVAGCSPSINGWFGGTIATWCFPKLWWYP